MFSFCVRFKVLTAASIKVTAFWDIAPCSLVGVDRLFKGTYCHHHQGDAETSVYSKETFQKAIIFVLVILSRIRPFCYGHFLLRRVFKL
jgi:hypothetical protein